MRLLMPPGGGTFRVVGSRRGRIPNLELLPKRRCATSQIHNPSSFKAHVLAHKAHDRIAAGGDL
jgi:hypothetical protein